MRILLIIAFAAMWVVLSLTFAMAEPRWHHHRQGPVIVRPDPGAGFLGGIIGGMIGGMLSKPEPAPPPPPPPPPPPEVLEPWTPEWYDFCGNKYRTFDPRTGYYNGFDGERHFCQGVRND